MPLISVSGRKIVESGSVTLGDGEKEAVLDIGPLKINFIVDYDADPSTPTKATAKGAEIDVVFSLIKTSQIVYWRATVSGGGESFDIVVLGRGMKKENIIAHTFDFTVSEAKK